MSANITISFAKWFINKHRDSGIFVNGNDFDFVISQLDNSSWDEFVTFNKDNADVDALIPQLVQKMPKKKTSVAPKNIGDAKPKSKKTRVDAQTSTNEPIEGDVSQVTEQPKEKKEIKKRAPKAKKNEVVAPVSEVVVTEVVVTDIVVSEVPLLIGEEPKEKKEVKKRAPKAKKNEVVAPVTDAVVEDEPKVKESKKRGPKKTVDVVTAPDDVIIPLLEQASLSEESYLSTEQQQQEEEETVLTEVFVNDVLFYVDSEENWFDSNLMPTTKQN
jgi:hypothetical protein